MTSRRRPKMRAHRYRRREASDSVGPLDDKELAAVILSGLRRRETLRGRLWHEFTSQFCQRHWQHFLNFAVVREILRTPGTG